MARLAEEATQKRADAALPLINVPVNNTNTHTDSSPPLPLHWDGFTTCRRSSVVAHPRRHSAISSEASLEGCPSREHSSVGPLASLSVCSWLRQGVLSSAVLSTARHCVRHYPRGCSISLGIPIWEHANHQAINQQQYTVCLQVPVVSRAKPSQLISLRTSVICLSIIPVSLSPSLTHSFFFSQLLNYQLSY